MESTTPTPVSEIRVGDQIAEADGFLWGVAQIDHPGPKTVELTFRPVYPSMTARGPRMQVSKRFRATSLVRLHQAATAYPRTVERGPGLGHDTVWACCESSIGPVCGHRAERVES